MEEKNTPPVKAPSKYLTREDLREPYEEEITNSLNYTEAFDVCRRSVQVVSDIEIFDADRKTGVIHAGSNNHMIVLTFTIQKITIGKSHIKILAITPDPILGPHAFLTGNNRLVVRTLIDFIQDQAPYQGDPFPVINEMQKEPIHIPDQERILTSEDPVPRALQSYSEPAHTGNHEIESPSRTGNEKSGGYWWIVAGIVMIVTGLAIDWATLTGMLSGVYSYGTLHHPNPYAIPRYEFLLFPLLPGIFALGVGLDIRRRGLKTVKTDTDPSAPTGILVGRGPFYRDPGFAAIYSAIIPGLGQAYNGRADRGLLLAFGAGGGLLFGLIPGIIIWIYAAYDAYVTAQQINRENVPAHPFQISLGIIIAAIFIPCVILTLFLFSMYGPAVALGLDFSTIKGP
jgi:hypothetical protein